jgi:hypothetical protein
MLIEYSKVNHDEKERTFDFFLKKDFSIGHYVFSIWYNSGDGGGQGEGEHEYPEAILANELVNLELNRNEEYSNNKPIKARFHGKTFKYYSPSLESLLKIYARSEGVPIEFEYLPPIKRK